jgi:hypothetical protein
MRVRSDAPNAVSVALVREDSIRAIPNPNAERTILTDRDHSVAKGGIVTAEIGRLQQGSDSSIEWVECRRANAVIVAIINLRFRVGFRVHIDAEEADSAVVGGGK